MLIMTKERVTSKAILPGIESGGIRKLTEATKANPDTGK
jgi:hypothetical protein